MSKYISKELAREIAFRHLSLELQKRCADSLKICDGIPDNISVYMATAEGRNDFWCISVPNLENTMHVGGGRYLLISKKNGRVVFDGFAGE